MQQVAYTLSSLVPYYFAMKWYRTEMRFFITSLLIFASFLFPSEILILFLTKNEASGELSLFYYQRAMVLKGIVNLLFLAALFAFFRDTDYFPNAMSSRDLDPLKKGLKLALSSWKLILIILSNDFSFFCLISIFRGNIAHYDPHYTILGAILSFVLFFPFYKKYRLRISLSFKIILVTGVAVNIVLLLCGRLAPPVIILAFGAKYLLTYAAIQFSIQLVYPVHLMNVAVAEGVLSTCFDWIFNSIDYLIQRNRSAWFYSLIGVFAAVSLILGVFVRSYFKPV